MPTLTTFAFTVLIACIPGQSWDWVAGEMGYVNLGRLCLLRHRRLCLAIVLVGGSPFWLAFVAALGVTALAALLLAGGAVVPPARRPFAFASLALLPPWSAGLQPDADHARRRRHRAAGGPGARRPISSRWSCVITFAVTLRIHGARFWLCAQEHPQRRAGGGDGGRASRRSTARAGSFRCVRCSGGGFAGLADELHRPGHR